MRQTFAIGIGGAAGQGVATPGDIADPNIPILKQEKAE
jgi:hypothetical protein